MDGATIRELYEPFDGKIETRQGPGGSYKFVPGQHIVDRMNRVFNGCWSTKVMYQEIIEDSVIVRVMVTVFDSMSDISYSHEGYGSSGIGRYKGDNKIISLDNAFKAAEMQAIKNACTRWGVGLFIDKSKSESGVNKNVAVNIPSVPNNVAVNIPSVPNAVPVLNEPVKQNKPTTANVQIPPGFGSVSNNNVEAKPQVTKKEPDFFAPPVVNKPVGNLRTTEYSIPPFVGNVDHSPPREKETQPVDMKSNGVIIDKSLSNKYNAPPNVGMVPNQVNDSSSEDYISDVQIAAISATMEMKNLKWSDFVKGALGEDYPVPEFPPKDMPYEIAVDVVKWGNNYGRTSQ